jgi:phosphohistidine phosphatase SixA
VSTLTPPLSKKTLILLRHAHREKLLGGIQDNGLSEKGKKQAERILKYYKKQFKTFEGDVALVSSPKVRCVETLMPIAEELDLKIQLENFLGEGGDLYEKTTYFLDWWKKKAPALTIACSHGDWLPICIERMAGMSVEMKKGAWVQVSLDGTKVLIQEIVQEP